MGYSGPRKTSRRNILRAAGLILPAMALSHTGLAATASHRRLRFSHLHTGEKLDVVYAEAGRYLPDALAEIDHLLRDFRTAERIEVDRGLLDMLADLHELAGSNAPFQIISGYRSPATNQMLRQRGGGRVAKRSLHMQGRAIDVRLGDIRTDNLRKAAVGLQQGGVGYYQKSDFLHIDTGRVRTW